MPGIVAVIYSVAHQLEGNVIQPLAVARKVELSPAIIAMRTFEHENTKASSQ